MQKEKIFLKIKGVSPFTFRRLPFSLTKIEHVASFMFDFRTHLSQAVTDKSFVDIHFNIATYQPVAQYCKRLFLTLNVIRGEKSRFSFKYCEKYIF